MGNDNRIFNANSKNVDHAVVADFGLEWELFDQRSMTGLERQRQFDRYFAVFPWEHLPADAIGFDAGCGSGRWAALAAPRVGHLHCVEPSSAIEVARKNLRHLPNCSFHQSTVDEMPFPDNSMDFGYSLGVLHHIPDTQKGINDCVQKLKPGAPFLVYLYYDFENQPRWFRVLWKVSDFARRTISKLPHRQKYLISQVIAFTVYFPFAKMALAMDKVGLPVHSFPLSSYRDKSFYTMRTDALDRFGTRIERRFSKRQVLSMLEAAGLERVQFTTGRPFWCAVGYKK